MRQKRKPNTLTEAYKMVNGILNDCLDACIAVIEDGVCTERISIDDVGKFGAHKFNVVYYYAAQIIKSKNWNECRDDIEHLMRWLGMEDVWKSADNCGFEDVIREESEKIGVNLV